ncbi:hypothetical protein [Bowmanella denitrificans]|nr:hypothetical protein [Bowmanella denitrificans]
MSYCNYVYGIDLAKLRFSIHNEACRGKAMYVIRFTSRKPFSQSR